MTYILRIGPWHVGPFDTHTGAQHWAERHGCDDYTMIPLDDPTEAPIRIHRMRMAPLAHPMKNPGGLGRGAPSQGVSPGSD